MLCLEFGGEGLVLDRGEVAGGGFCDKGPHRTRLCCKIVGLAAFPRVNNIPLGRVVGYKANAMHS